MTNELETQPRAERPPYIKTEADRTAPYKNTELRDKLAKADEYFINQSAIKEAGHEYLEDLYQFLRDVQAIDTANPHTAEGKKLLDESLIWTEIARVRHHLYTRERNHLSNTQELSRWQGAGTAFARAVLRHLGEEKARLALASYWQVQEEMFTKEFGSLSQTELAGEFGRHKRGVLTAVAFEESLGLLDGWTFKIADKRKDAAQSIDYTLQSLDGNTFLVQLTSTNKPDAPVAACQEMTAKRKPKDLSGKEGRFWKGVNAYVINRQLQPAKVRAVYVTLSQNDINPTTGQPSAVLQQELTKSLDSVDTRGGWSDPAALSYERRPR